MAIAQSILDAQARLDAAVVVNSQKVDALIAQIAAGQSGMSQADIDATAAAINSSAAAVEAINQK